MTPRDNAEAGVRQAMPNALWDRQVVLDAVAAHGLEDDLARAYDDAFLWRAGLEARDRRIDSVVDVVLGVLLYGPIVVVLLFLLGMELGGGQALVFSLVAALVEVVVLLGLVRLAARLSPRFQTFCYITVSACMVGSVYFMWRQVDSVFTLLNMIAAEPWSAAFTLAAVVPLAAVGIAVPVALIGTWWQLRSATRAQPRLALLFRLFVLTGLLTNPRALTEDKALLLNNLYLAAAVLDVGFRPDAHLVSPLSRAIWRQRWRQSAQRLRSFDLWVVLPRADTRENLLAEVTALIHVLLCGRLDELPTAEHLPRRRLAAFGNAVRNLLPGLIPLAVVFGGQFVGLDPSTATGGTLVVTATTVFALVAFTAFDNQVATRLSTVKDAVSVVTPFLGKS